MLAILIQQIHIPIYQTDKPCGTKNKVCSSGTDAGYGCLSQDYASNTFHKYTFQFLDCHSTQKVKHVLVAMIQNFVQKHFDLTYKSIVIFLFPGIYQFTPFSSFIIILY